MSITGTIAAAVQLLTATSFNTQSSTFTWKVNLILSMNMEDSAKSGIHQLIILLMRNLYPVPLYVAAGAGLGTLPIVPA